MTLPGRARAVRAFNRFYTQQIGLLHKSYLDSPFSLSEMRVLYELAHRDAPDASSLSRDLDLDAGYLSRIIRKFENLGYIRRKSAKSDARKNHLLLTASGRAAFSRYESQADRDIAALLTRLAPGGQQRLVEAMQTIENLLSATTKRTQGNS